MPATHVESVVQFYSFLYDKPRGRYRILFSDNLNSPFVFSTIGSGELVGASWLLSSRRWTYDARAMEPAIPLAIDVDALMAVCEQSHSLGYGLLKSIDTVLNRRMIEARIQASDIYVDWS